MTATKHITLWCDFRECPKWTDHGDEFIRNTRLLAKNEGWVFRNGSDFCCLDHALGRLTEEEAIAKAWTEGKAGRALEMRHEE